MKKILLLLIPILLLTGCGLSEEIKPKPLIKRDDLEWELIHLLEKLEKEVTKKEDCGNSFILYSDCFPTLKGKTEKLYKEFEALKDYLGIEYYEETTYDKGFRSNIK